MLRIYPVVLDWLEQSRKSRATMRTSQNSSAVQAPAGRSTNMVEAIVARAGNRSNAYGIALREMRESYAALEVAARFGYVKRLDETFEGRCRQILGTLVKLVFPSRR